jgi:hypothetical protein
MSRVMENKPAETPPHHWTTDAKAEVLRFRKACLKEYAFALPLVFVVVVLFAFYATNDFEQASQLGLGVALAGLAFYLWLGNRYLTVKERIEAGSFGSTLRERKELAAAWQRIKGEYERPEDAEDD